MPYVITKAHWAKSGRNIVQTLDFGNCKRGDLDVDGMYSMTPLRPLEITQSRFCRVSGIVAAYETNLLEDDGVAEALARGLGRRC